MQSPRLEGLIRKGEARPSPPETAAPPSPQPQEPAPANGAGEGGQVAAGRLAAQQEPQAPPRPAARPVTARAAMGVRLPLDIAAGIAAVVYYTGEEKQAVVARMLEEGLDRWNKDWRFLIPEQ